MSGRGEEGFTLVVRKPCFNLPTGCPDCLPVYIYLRLANLHFHLDFNLIYPESDIIPYVETGNYVAYNNEKGGVIECLRQDGIVDLDSEFLSLPEWVSAKSMVSSWLADAVMYELWLGTDGASASKVYYSDLPWPIGKVLFLKKLYSVKLQLGINKENAERREEQIYRNANLAYGALSNRLGEQNFLFENRPSSLDALVLGHLLFTLQVLPETSVLRSKLLEHSNLVRYAEKYMTELVEVGTSSSPPPSSSRSSTGASSSTPRRGPYNWSSKPKPKPKREKTNEEKTFKRRGKYFVGAQLVAVLLFLTLMGRGDDAEVELDDDDEGYDYSE
ncbi:mitochondrial outer membrane import complex protein METAXIN isoform X1 [Cucumis melo var. makuwa]|uniref:Mitochondrial outer membrane import complex protein METAXIN isoform X1 n=2 Tax=Cucumis melo TaxID=3656 RepID=A0A5D3DXJ0_CUCMM|nr:mitochondrial outer membrane import complex protein METAXIN isoform X1 [Cucumis melo]TYK28587.1 mitochondrial outer membrane import complex protein METAXIN isoform X1 [Cucumis melo var. makuwa]